MRLLNRSGCVAAVNTDGPQWVVPTRLAGGVLLLCPIDGSIQQLFTFYHVDRSALSFGVVAAGMLLRTVEILAGLSFFAGFGRRLMGAPAVAIFTVMAVPNSSNSFALVPDIVNGGIVPHAAWGTHTRYAG